MSGFDTFGILWLLGAVLCAVIGFRALQFWRARRHRSGLLVAIPAFGLALFAAWVAFGLLRNAPAG